MEPAIKTETLGIEGLPCAFFVEKTLARTAGVQRAVVNYATEKATIDYLPAEASPATLKATVVQASYGIIKQIPDKSAADRQAEIDQQRALAYQQLRWRFWVAVGLALVIMPLDMLMLWPALMARMPMPVPNYALLLLTLPVLLLQRPGVPRRRLERLPPPHRQHGYAYCRGHRRGFFLQRSCHRGARLFHPLGARARSVLRYHGHHYCPYSAGQSAGNVGQSE